MLKRALELSAKAKVESNNMDLEILHQVLALTES
jgi:hypothetical protein